jgi:hypothetical protein
VSPDTCDCSGYSLDVVHRLCLVSAGGGLLLGLFLALAALVLVSAAREVRP